MTPLIAPVSWSSVILMKSVSTSETRPGEGPTVARTWFHSACPRNAMVSSAPISARAGMIRSLAMSPISTIAALVKEEDRHAEQAELARPMTERVGVLLHGVADEDESIDLVFTRRLDRVVEDALDLSLTAAAEDPAHGAVEIGAVGKPPARLALMESAVEDELNLETPERRRGLEHLALDMTRAIPARLSARGRIHREDQPAAPRRTNLRHGLDPANEGIDIAARRGLG